MDDLDKIARELLAAELDRRGLRSVAAAVVNGSYDSEPDHAAIRAALLTAPPGYVLVPVDADSEDSDPDQYWDDIRLADAISPSILPGKLGEPVRFRPYRPFVTDDSEGK